MVYVVTGATGCVGMSLCERLAHEGQQVIALGRNLHRGHRLAQLGVQFIAIDLKDTARLKKILQPAEVLVHCAALSRPWGSWEMFYETNVVGTQNILRNMPQQTRLIYLSTPSIYFAYREKHNIKEDDPLPKKPANHYVKSKLLAEKLVDEAYQRQRFPLITLRPRAIIGPYDDAIIPRVLKAEKNGVLTLIGDGSALIDMTYVDNVVESILLAARANEHCFGKKYNITNDEPLAINAIITTLYQALDRALKIKHIRYRYAKYLAHGLQHLHRIFPFLGEPRLTPYSCGVLALGQTLDISAAKKDLCYKPLIQLQEGLHRYAQWYRTHDNLPTL